MNIIFGSTTHIRFSPVKHRFTYPIYMVDVDIEKLDAPGSKLVSIESSDHLHPDNRPLSEKLGEFTSQLENEAAISKINMVTIPRFLQKTFRPVCFYICYNTDSDVIGLIAEVTNTYKESHVYVLNGHGGRGMQASKTFHVSPFFNEEGAYYFNVLDTDKRLAIHIDYVVDDKSVFYANFVGNKCPFSLAQKLRLITLWPLTNMLVMPRILWQAARLYFQKKLPAKSKPAPPQHNTTRHMPLTFLEKKVQSKLQQINRQLSEDILGQITIHHNWFYRAIALSGKIGLGESYVKGYWDTPDLPKLIGSMIRSKTQLEAQFSGSSIVNVLNRWEHIRHRNTRQHSKENIEAHYDLGNEFYALFLDDTMTYSSGLFDTATTTLEQAQHNKVDALVSGLQIQPGEHVLEIGSGWGFVATTIAKRYDCKVTTVTLSHEQHDYVTSLIAAQGLHNQVTVKLMDYRELTGQYDAIISVEMIEAVGHGYLDTYFIQCHDRLKPGGRFVLQAITYPDAGYEAYRKGSDFIRKHIFPGGHLPSLGAIASHTTRFTQIQRQDIALSYAKTLRCWADNVTKNKAAIHALGFDEAFYRKWQYYLAYCEAAFQTEFLGCHQIVFEKKRG